MYKTQSSPWQSGIAKNITFIVTKDCQLSCKYCYLVGKNEKERIEEQRNRTIEGTGLGMNITQRLLELMGSHIEVKSVYGEGSVFSFALRQRVVNWDPLGDF